MLGGLKTVIDAHPEKFNAIGGPHDPVPFLTMFTGMLLVNLFYWGCNQTIIQRALAAKNLKEGQKGLMLAAVFVRAAVFDYPGHCGVPYFSR